MNPIISFLFLYNQYLLKHIYCKSIMSSLHKNIGTLIHNHNKVHYNIETNHAEYNAHILFSLRLRSGGIIFI